MNRTILFVLLFALFVLPVTCAFADSGNDDLLSNKIVGTWVMHKKNDYAEMYGETNYKDDGSFQSDGYFIFDGEKSMIEFSGNWSIKEGVLTEDVKKSNTPEISGASQFRVLSISDKHYNFISLKSGEADYATRK